jgi:hypothetical protein
LIIYKVWADTLRDDLFLEYEPQKKAPLFGGVDELPLEVTRVTFNLTRVTFNLTRVTFEVTAVT